LIPLAFEARIVLGVIGGFILLYGIVGWVLVEDVHMFPSDSPGPHGEARH
jgi:hypothetical protein